MSVGELSLLNNTGGSGNIAVGTQSLCGSISGTNNIAIGNAALGSLSSNCQNVAIGNSALGASNSQYNTAVGHEAGCASTSGNNVFIGRRAGVNVTSGFNNVLIGSGVNASSPTVNQEVNLWNNAVVARFQGAAVAWSFVSDARDKTEIEDLPLGLDFIRELQPRKFKWDLRNSEADKGREASGFIAQEVLGIEEKFDARYAGIVSTNDPEQYTLATAAIVPILVNAVKELAKDNAALRARVEKLEG